jgi:hypothetical protein
VLKCLRKDVDLLVSMNLKGYSLLLAVEIVEDCLFSEVSFREMSITKGI